MTNETTHRADGSDRISFVVRHCQLWNEGTGKQLSVSAVLSNGCKCVHKQQSFLDPSINCCAKAKMRRLMFQPLARQEFGEFRHSSGSSKAEGAPWLFDHRSTDSFNLPTAFLYCQLPPRAFCSLLGLVVRSTTQVSLWTRISRIARNLLWC